MMYEIHSITPNSTNNSLLDSFKKECNIEIHMELNGIRLYKLRGFINDKLPSTSIIEEDNGIRLINLDVELAERAIETHSDKIIDYLNIYADKLQSETKEVYDALNRTSIYDCIRKELDWIYKNYINRHHWVRKIADELLTQYRKDSL